MKCVSCDVFMDITGYQEIQRMEEKVVVQRWNCPKCDLSFIERDLFPFKKPTALVLFCDICCHPKVFDDGKEKTHLPYMDKYICPSCKQVIPIPKEVKKYAEEME